MILAAAGISCSESKQNQIKEACGNEDIREIRKVDNISKGCREALSSLLPGPEDNLKSKIIQFAHENGDFYLGALDSSGKAMATSDLQTLTVKVTVAGVVSEVPSGFFSLDAISGLSNSVLSLSLLSDYSGSMQDEDIAEVSSLFKDLAINLNSIAETEHILFSSTTRQSITFSRDLTAVQAAIAVDPTFERSSTALYDGMGMGLTHLASSTRPGKIIVVGTDGAENSSTTWTKAAITAAIAEQKNLLVVFMATNFADLDLIKELVGNKGFYAYTETLLDARERLTELSTALKQGVRLRLRAPYDNVDSVVVTHPESKITGPSWAGP
jgi:hypothetical protein